MSDQPVALVIGYGNTLRGDDGVGPLAADTIRGWGLEGVAAISITQLTPELAEPISAARLAVFSGGLSWTFRKRAKRRRRPSRTLNVVQGNPIHERWKMFAEQLNKPG